MIIVDWLRSLILGIVQGLTEFLPVSSSGHLEIAKFILGEDIIGNESLLMTVVLHFATALATIVVFRKEIMEIIIGLFNPKHDTHRVFAYKIILSMIPAVVIGLLFEKQLEEFFTQNILLVCSMLLITGFLLFFADKSPQTDGVITYKNALIIGLAQAVAILPGISRSGATISTSLLLGVDREKAAKFSFLMVLPLIFGKIAKDGLDGDFGNLSISTSALLTGFAGAFIAGYWACTWMIALVKKSKLKYFAYYCWVIGLIGIIYVYTK